MKASRIAYGHLLLLIACGQMPEPTGGNDDHHYLIAMNSQQIDTRIAPDEAGAAGDRRVLVKFPGPVTAEQFAALAATAQIYTYLPYDTFVVRPHAGLIAARATGASWTGAYLPEYKIAPAVTALAQQAALAAAETRTMMITAFPDADLAGVAAIAAGVPGVTVVGSDRGARFSRVRLRVADTALAGAAAALAAHADVFWIDVEGRRELLNDTTIWVGQSGLDAGMTTPVFDHGIHGEGQVVGYIDTGIDADSCYFRDAARGLPPINACDGGTTVDPLQRKVLAVDFSTPSECAGGIAANEWDTQNHGSHVAGTIAGDNLANPIVHDPGDGMAPGAKLVVQDAGFLTDDCGDLPGIGCPVVDLKPFFQQAYTQGARIHTNSWGDNENAFVQNNYSAACQDVDEFMFSHPDFLILFAAGNSGPRAASVGSPSVAKNGISVGATRRGTQANSMANFSSCGPAADGRLKPDLTMPGQGIISARNDRNVGTNNCSTITMSGTSMASPAAAGMAALVRQYYTDGFYPTGAAVAGHGFTPSAALVKGTLLNSTQQMTGTGAGPAPDACQGWGRVLLDDALFFDGQARRLVAVDDPGFPQGAAGQERHFAVQVDAGQSLRATLAWTDFPSTPAASINLENDLDLEVTGPSGSFLGNVFAAGQSAAGGSPDRLNNVEQVLLAAPAPGLYHITVRAFNVPSSAQPFALVISGAIQRSPAAPETVIATAIADTRILVQWQPSSGAVKYLVDQAAAGDPAFTPLGTVTGGTTELLATNLTASTRYCYRVTGVDAFDAQSAPSVTVCDTTLAPGLGSIEGFWKLDEGGGNSAIDSSGFGHDGAITSATYSLQDRPTVDNDRSALAFSSSPDSAVFIPPATGLDLASPSFTVSFWTKLPAAGNVSFLGSSTGDCIHPAWQIAQNASGLRIFDARGLHTVAASIPTGVWTHVAIVGSRSSFSLDVYLDGALVSTVSNSLFGLAHAPFYIGHVAGCPAGAVMMDNVQILSRAMSAAEIAAIGAHRTSPTH
jgi:subtilase family protein/concanavalin A-like lectin/glucanase superfamily protein/fibronectin type III domain protein